MERMYELIKKDEVHPVTEGRLVCMKEKIGSSTHYTSRKLERKRNYCEYILLKRINNKFNI